MYLCMYVCMHVCMYPKIYVCVHVCNNIINIYIQTIPNLALVCPSDLYPSHVGRSIPTLSALSSPAASAHQVDGQVPHVASNVRDAPSTIFATWCAHGLAFQWMEVATLDDSFKQTVD